MTSPPTGPSPSLQPLPGNEHLALPPTGDTAPWLALDKLPSRPDEFSFVLLSDRTGVARPGVFERGIEVTNLLRPDFALQIGDVIEGATTDADQLAREWAEFDGITDVLDVPLFRVPGNHDVTNEFMRTEWQRRFGLFHYHFIYRDVLVVVLDTSDPPQEPSDYVPALAGMSWDDVLTELEELRQTDPEAMAGKFIDPVDWDAVMPAKLSEEQVAWAEQVIAEHADVRWTIVCMHMPLWQGEHPTYARLRAALGERPFTMFAGHVHNYRRTVIDGRDHIRLGPTGGIWVIDGDEGNFDHVTWVTMTADGPRIANIVLDGVLGAAGGVYPPRQGATTSTS